jgi:hypothetical protein
MMECGNGVEREQCTRLRRDTPRNLRGSLPGMQ